MSSYFNMSEDPIIKITVELLGKEWTCVSYTKLHNPLNNHGHYATKQEAIIAARKWCKENDIKYEENQ